MEQWNMDNLEAIVREANKTRDMNLYQVQQRTYIKLYKNRHIFTGIDPSRKFCLYEPLLTNEDENMSLAKQVKKIERSEIIPSFETFQRTFRRELPKILNFMLNLENSLELFKQGGEYQFSTVQNVVIQNLLYLWITEDENAQNFSKERYNEVAPQFLQDLQTGVRYLLMGCFEDKFDLEELQQTWKERFECIPKSELSELKAEWEKAKERLQESLRDLRETMYCCILDETSPNDIMSIEPDQDIVWPIRNQIKYMAVCEKKLDVLIKWLFNNSLRGHNEAYKDINERIKKLKQQKSYEDKPNSFNY